MPKNSWKKEKIVVRHNSEEQGVQHPRIADVSSNYISPNENELDFLTEYFRQTNRGRIIDLPRWVQ